VNVEKLTSVFGETLKKIVKANIFRVAFPAVTAVFLFLISIFGFILPSVQNNFLEHKRNMIRELTRSAYGIIAYRHKQEVAGELTHEQAQQKAIDEIRALRYGPEGKDYFWINDLQPKMIMHPYRHDLEGTYVGDFTDSQGQALFMAFVDVAKTQGEGYVDYHWQWKDDIHRDEPKESFIKLFAPWGWIIGTGMYLDDVNAEMMGLTRKIVVVALVILLAIVAISIYLIRQGYQAEKKRLAAEQELDFSEKRFHLLVDTMSEGLIAQSADGRFIFANKRFCQMTGYTTSELQGQLLINYIAPDKRQIYEDQMIQRRQRKQESYELVWKTKDGGDLYTIIAPQGIWDDKGELIGSFGVVTDITSHMTIEQELRESRERYRAMFDNMTNAVAVYKAVDDGADFVLLEFNRAAETIEQISREQVIGRRVTEVFPQVREFGILEALYQVWLTGHPESMPAMRYSDDRITGWRKNQIYKLPSGEIVALYEDITEQKEAEQKIRESDLRFRELADSISYLFLALDKNLRFTYFNKAATALTSVEPEKAIGKELLEVFPILADTPVPKNYRQVLHDKQPRHFTTDIKTSDETTIHFEISVFPTQDGISVLAHDITERVKSEEKKQQLEHQLQQSQKLEAIGRLAGGVAHDFNNLLAGILGNIDLAKVAEPEKTRHHLDLAFEAATRAGNLVQQLLLFSRRSRSTFQAVDVGDIARQVTGMLRETIDRRIAIRHHIADDLELAHADPNQVYQVLLNLCINARDALTDLIAEHRSASPAIKENDYFILISGENVKVDEEYARLRHEAKTGRYLMISVSDNGPGIDEQTSRHIFEPFFTTKEQGRGTGLGLATVYGIMQQHGGWIEVESQAEKGATFRVFFPADGEAVLREAPVEDEDLPAGTETVLLVDDEEIIRNMAKAILLQRGYSVMTAAEGHEALQVFNRQKERIDLVILDQTMPHLSGEEVLQQIIALKPNAKVLMCSGYAEHQLIDKFKAFGATGFLAKPYNMYALSHTVRKVLDGQIIFPK